MPKPMQSELSRTRCGHGFARTRRMSGTKAYSGFARTKYAETNTGTRHCAELARLGNASGTKARTGVASTGHAKNGTSRNNFTPCRRGD